MPFPSAKQRVPTTIGLIVVDFGTDQLGAVSYQARIEVLDAQGNAMAPIAVNLQPILSAGQKTAIDNFMAALRTQATNEILS